MLISADAYAIAWTLYVLGFLVAYFSFTRLTLWLRPPVLRQTMKGFLIVFFLTPVQVDPARDWYSPAWLQGGYESILGDVSAASDAIFNLSVAAAVMAVVIVIDALWRWRKTRNAPAAPSH
ncbi:MAG: hypothetical protein CL583_05305 [Alteromonadaceae bacterium]|nr:hypothetical protein [Alteromonadaceae bacterium]|tara:strand:+ start:2664 stop:3026 length:363 start_codon:yes stop_codon:yes gene_type:complete